MKFVFRYETLLSYRGHLKEKAEIELSRARQRLREAQLHLETSRGRLKEAKDSFDSRIAGGMTAGEIRNHSDYLSGLKTAIQTGILRVAKCEEEVRKRKDDLLDITKQYKVIEKLKEKDFQKWQHQQNLIEQKRMDEVAVTRHGRAFL